MKEHIKLSEIFDVSNVAEYMDASEKIWDMKDFILLPPYNRMWMEYRYNQDILSDSICCGAYIEAVDFVNSSMYISSLLEKHKITIPYYSGKYNIWSIIMIYPFENEYIPVTAYMMVVEKQSKKLANMYDISGLIDGIYVKDIGEKLPESMLPFLLSITLLNCKNVSTERHTPTPKWKKICTKKHGIPPVVFKTLKVDMFRSVKKTDRKPEDNLGLRRKLHAVRGHLIRGHIRTYTKEKPLFGKVVGSFFVEGYWKNSHHRGNMEEGMVIKDYKLIDRELKEEEQCQEEADTN
jgi:hypothetical protein